MKSPRHCLRHRSLLFLALVTTASSTQYTQRERRRVQSMRKLLSKMEEDPLRRDLGKRKRAKKSESYDSIEDNIFDHGSLSKVDTEDAFLAYCQTQLLSYPVAADGLISQSDAAMFIQDICDIMDDEDLPDFQCPTPTFFNSRRCHQ